MKFFSKILFVLIFLSLYSLSSFAANRHAMPIMHVDVYRVPKPMSEPIIFNYPARLKSVKNVTIVARVDGVLLKKFYNEGEYVKKNQILYKIEPDTYNADLALALAELEKAKATLYKVKRDWLRYKALYKKKAISSQKMDSAVSLYKDALSSVAAAKAKIELAKINLGYTNVKATINGTTGLKLVDIGDYVHAGESLVKITQTNPIYAEFSFPDKDIFKMKSNISKGLWIEKSPLDAYIIKGGKKYKGYVDFIDSNVDLNTSTVKARAVFKNGHKQLMSGEFVRIKIGGIVQKNVITIPQEALVQNNFGKIVFIVKNGKVEVRPVRVSIGANNMFIVNWGLKPNDLVVVDNFFKIRPNMPVKIDKIINKK